MTAKQDKKQEVNFHALIRESVKDEVEILIDYLNGAIQEEKHAQKDGEVEQRARAQERIIRLTQGIAAIKAQTVVAAAQAQASAAMALFGSLGKRATAQAAQDETRAGEDLAVMRAQMLADKAAGK